MALMDENGLENDESFSTLEEEVQPITETNEEKQEEDIPEKYRGKTAAEIIKMHQEAEKLIGKQGSEVGELRRLVDDFIKSQTPSKKQEVEEEDETDFFVDPKKAIDKRVEKHPAVKEAKEASIALRRAETIKKLESSFPDMYDTVQDPEFQEWVKSSKVRLELYARADGQFDYDAGVELLSTWNERKQAKSKVNETLEADRKAQLRAASTTTQGSSEAPSKKMYRRTDIIALMQNNPDKYEALYPEIAKAYQEGRVK